MLTGRLVLRRDRELTIEIDAEATLDWEPERAEVWWREGTTVRAEIIAERTTAPGLVAVGLVLRLSLRLITDGPVGAPERVLVRTKHGPVMIKVIRA